MMNKSLILCIVLAFSSAGTVFATSVCDNAPCEKMINSTVGNNFTITFESASPATGYQWWVSFDPEYVSLISESYVQNKAMPGMVGVPGMESFTFNSEKAGETDITMLLLQPWENGTVGQRKIFPVTIAE